MPWFVEKSKYPPRPGNVIEPLINGERAFRAVHEAIASAKKSVDIVSWGFDPSMRFIRPNGDRLGNLLRRKADPNNYSEDGKPSHWSGEPSVEIRVLIWKSALANLGENNIIGDGLFGSGGTTALGSGTGSAGSGSSGGSSSGSGSSGDDYNDYANKFASSAAVQRDDSEAKAFNRGWFRYQPPSMEFRTRDFSLLDRTSIASHQIAQRGLASPTRTYLLTDFASHHQKMILVDYELPDAAVGFVMGHNLLRNYWDTDAHEYWSELRLGFAPWQDLSCRVRGPVLYDLNENFMKAWDRAEGLGSKFFWTDARKARKAEDFIEPAKRHGAGTMAQICRTQSQESDRSILEIYKLALGNARNYLYFENQYFRYKEFADLLRTTRRRLKAGGWKRDFYLFVVTNVPPGAGRLNTYEMLAALGKGSQMPAVDKNSSGKRDSDSDLRKSDLDGVNIHLCTLLASGKSEKGVKYKEIYVHSKLLLVDDVFFTLGSANVNVRSMETDSELNIAAPSPELTQQWRKHLWKLHTGKEPGDSIATEFENWGKLMTDNKQQKNAEKALSASLIEFFDGEDATLAPD
jgi:phosphatidylserine/phosphatidylglycerophosphate/cardiolipin synthase-like enzyme